MIGGFKSAKKVLNYNLEKLAKMLEDKNIHELIYILGSKKEIIKRNFIAGITRGIGIGIGVTLISAVLIYLLQKIVRLNLPIIGEFIKDIIDIVENTKT